MSRSIRLWLGTAFASGRTVATTFLAGASSRDPENRDGRRLSEWDRARAAR
jgi:hypothetical protein